MFLEEHGYCWIDSAPVANPTHVYERHELDSEDSENKQAWSGEGLVGLRGMGGAMKKIHRKYICVKFSGNK